MDQKTIDLLIEKLEVFDDGPMINVLPEQYREQVYAETGRIIRAMRNGTFNEETWDFPEWWIEITGRDW